MCVRCSVSVRSWTLSSVYRERVLREGCLFRRLRRMWILIFFMV